MSDNRENYPSGERRQSSGREAIRMERDYFLFVLDAMIYLDKIIHLYFPFFRTDTMRLSELKLNRGLQKDLSK